MRFFILLLILVSCVSDPSKQSRNAYLLEEEDNTLSEVIEDITILLDLYPINGEIDKEKLSYELQRPRQFFSSGSNNEIRLHKLGQIRWLYVESLPSSVWPILNQYIENENDLSIGISDPDEGVIETEIFNRKDKEVKYRFKVEHGIRQASTELFFTELVKKENDWAILDNDNSEADDFLRKLLDYFSSATVSQGTSLVALNLNQGRKSEVINTDDGKSYIKLSIGFARTWAALNRALKEAAISIKDLNREEGYVLINYGLPEEEGILARLRKSEPKEYKIIVRSSSDDLTQIMLDSEEWNDELESLLSEINQSLS
ncbi:MAG: outer membrane protein assembly factor BamC [Gammaproteobacteria bacterium]|jgi:outer membrane protein assembly factor BamC|nr:MAG: outer membrane protein assembly factor BamC [Gammaproteobacteria bacterium]